MRSFEKLEVWQRSCSLAIEICQHFDECKNYTLKDQLTRSAISVPSNVAEGAERFSRKEFIQFLGYAKGSAGEMKTQIIIANKLGYIDDTVLSNWMNAAMILGLARSLGSEL